MASLFGPRALAKYWELIPVVTIVGGAVVGAGAASIYFLLTKSDVNLKTDPRNIGRWDRINPEVPQKLLTYRVKYEKIPELEVLRREIGSYKSS